jgi:hypothetical protein
MTDDRLAYTMMKLKNETSRISLFGIIYFSREYYSRCSLGDTTNNDACYEKALEVSNNRSARAKVSLCICLVYCAYILHVCFYDIIKWVMLNSAPGAMVKHTKKGNKRKIKY